ncbi:MAG: PilZ domain-containing protein [Candidatus Aureabacteria bacterium]|nr:PilZ domain-containing protein [Candidatus Auribacterota bacterium]
MFFLDSSGREKRQYIRIPYRETVNFYSLNEPEAERKTHEAKAQNISLGGMLFLTGYKFSPYEEIHLEFKLQYPGNIVKMNLWAQVVWMEVTQSNDLYSVGVKFQNLSQQQKDELAAFVQSSLKK